MINLGKNVPHIVIFLRAVAVSAVLFLQLQAAEEGKRAYHLEAADAATALRQFSEASGREILFAADAIRGIHTNSVHGEFSAAEAIHRLLANTSLYALEDPANGAFAVRKQTGAMPTKSAIDSQSESHLPQDPKKTTMKTKSPFAVFVGWIALALASPEAAMAADSSSTARSAAGQETITGVVTNAATGKTLEGARVVLQGTGRETLTDNQGAYRFSDVALGNVVLSVSYTGLNNMDLPVVVAAGTANRRDVGLTSDVYTLSKFVVSGEREGNALAITLQRNSSGVKSVVSTDAFGSLDGNPADLLIHLPGVSGTPQDGDFRFVQIRGMNQALGTVTRDGDRMANGSQSGAREFQFMAVSSESIERVEVVKSPTPDMDGDSIGGAINMVTKSAFDRLPAGRRFNFAIGGQWRVMDKNDVPRGIGTLSYSEVFGEKFGISANLSRRQQFTTENRTQNNFENKVEDPAYTYRTVRDQSNIYRSRNSGDVKFDYKLSDHTRFSFTTAISKHIEYYSQPTATYATGQTVATRDAAGNLTGTGSIVPGYTKDTTEWRPLSTSTLTMLNLLAHNHRSSVHAQFAGVHKYSNLDIDYSAYKSRGENYAYPNGQFSMIARGVGIRLDRAGQPDQIPQITQTGGPDVTRVTSYTENLYDHFEAYGVDIMKGGAINLKKQFATVVPAYIKLGVRQREQQRNLTAFNWNATYVGPDKVMGPNAATGVNDDNLAQFLAPNPPKLNGFVSMSPVLPYPAHPGQYDLKGLYNNADIADTLFNAHPEQFAVNLANKIQNELTGRQTLTEKISSAYIMGDVNLGKLSILGGVRVERTQTNGEGAKNIITPEEAALRAAFVGPLTDAEITRRTKAQYGGRQTARGEYRNVFPGLHFKYEPIRGLITRASYSSNIGRPNIGTLIPSTTVSVTQQTVATSNPSLKAQYANNFDVGLEYYFEPVGMVSAGVFLKEMKDFIFTQGGILIPAGPDNGFGGDYVGYNLTTQRNGGTAKVQGFELNYQQQFTFLPGWWSGFSFNANYTKLEASGNYGGTTVLSTSQVAGFVPESGSMGLSYIKNKVTVRLQGTYAGRFLRAYSTSPARLDYARPQTMINLKTVYQISRHYDFYLDVNNVFNEADRNWEFYPKRGRYLQKLGGAAFVSGITGRF